MINDGIAEYQIDGNKKNIKAIDRDDLMTILAKIYNDQSIQITNPNIDTNTINNPAEKIIFENILAKLTDFYNRRKDLRNQIDSVFSDAEKQYAEEISQEPND